MYWCFDVILLQVLSNSVAKELNESPATIETAKFCAMFNKFFDCLNARSTKEYIKKKNIDIAPYESRGDERLKVSNVMHALSKNMILLTYSGLRMNSFCI